MHVRLFLKSCDVQCCGGTNSTASTPPSTVLSLSQEREWMNEN